MIAPDKFAGTLTAHAAAAAIERGWRQVRPNDDIRRVPMADGGEGTIDVLLEAVGGAVTHTEEVPDARGIATSARWLLLPDGTAVIESAEVVGLSRLRPSDRDPLRTTSYGLGMLLRVVAATAPRQIVVGLGGSATVDGGAGMLSALGGHGLRRADGNGVKVGGRWVAEAVRLRPLPALGVPVIAASDVVNPLLGPAGAARVFGPQKGATPDGVALLEDALRQLAGVVERDLPGGPWRDMPGAGAAGGLGFALMAVGAEMRSGAGVVAEMVGLDLVGAGLLVTGEGALDAQTTAGKVPEHVRALAERSGVPALAVAGRIEGDVARRFSDVEALGPDGMTQPETATVAAAARLASRV